MNEHMNVECEICDVYEWKNEYTVDLKKMRDYLQVNKICQILKIMRTKCYMWNNLV
jgi:hypothetical protein